MKAIHNARQRLGVASRSVMRSGWREAGSLRKKFIPFTSAGRHDGQEAARIAFRLRLDRVCNDPNSREHFSLGDSYCHLDIHFDVHLQSSL